MLKFSSPPDAGIRRALRLPDISRGGKAIELGAGSARNLVACYRKGYTSTAYDVAPWMVERAKKSFARRHIKAEFLSDDALQIQFVPESLSIVILGTPIYWPKSILTQYLTQVWEALLVNGVMHVEFATPRDETISSDFFLITCKPYPDEGFTNSYFHYCGFPCSFDHPGVLGTSFWEKQEITDFLKTLGDWNLIYRKVYEWDQDTGDEVPIMRRSFDRITIQKKS